MKVINLFAGPGTGKSTTAAGLFFLMKHAGYNVELINEFAKQLVWQERHRTFSDQYYISAKQNHKLEVLRDKVDYVITDSPLPLSLVYAPKKYFGNFRNMLMEIFNSYDNINYFLNRTKPYNPIGRNQTEEEERGVVEQVNQMLKNNNISYYVVNADQQAPQVIYDHIAGFSQ